MGLSFEVFGVRSGYQQRDLWRNKESSDSALLEFYFEYMISTALASRSDPVCVRVDTGRGTTFGVLLKSRLGLFIFPLRITRYIRNLKI
ncbi:hypothetical protein YC2023_018302 [Brassica napus]